MEVWWVKPALVPGEFDPLALLAQPLGFRAQGLECGGSGFRLRVCVFVFRF